jgi:hypothetical protein
MKRFFRPSGLSDFARKGSRQSFTAFPDVPDFGLTHRVLIAQPIHATRACLNGLSSHP